VNADALDLDAWVPFFTAAAGASAALVGLIIVAMSVNVETIVGIRSLPARAIATIGALTYVVVTSVFALVPALQPAWFGVVLLLFALPSLGFAIDAAVRVVRDHGGGDEDVSRSGIIGRAVVGLIPIAVALVAGVLVLVGSTAGLVLVAVAYVLVFLTSVLNAWVLLIEIRR
jgi:hypothetical protein